MTDPDAPSGCESMAEVAEPPTQSMIFRSQSRRRFLHALTSGGALALSGCGQSDSTTPTDTSAVNGKTFRAPIGQDPAKTAFYGWGLVSTLQDTAYATVVKEPASYSLRRFLREPGVWINGQLGGPRPNVDVQYNWIKKPIEITPNAVTITIQDDAMWSDGHPVTGTDIALRPIEATLMKWRTPKYLPAYAPGTQNEPNQVRLAFDEFEITDKSVTYRSSQGYFEQFIDKNIALWLGPFYPSISPTHIEPFKTYADAMIDTARQAQAGDIYPWYKRGIGDPNRSSLIETHLAQSKYVKKFSKPENVLGTGAWKLVELRGSNEFVFEKNPHHRHADAINFDTFLFEYTPSAERARAGLKSDRFDYASPGTTPPAVEDSFPAHLKSLRVPGGLHTGNELRLNHNHPALAVREVRLAIMYTLDQSSIAKNIHQSVAVPVTTPGGDSWKATDYVDQTQIDTTFTTYSQDRAKAARLMRAAGYTRDGGQWIDSDGEALTLTLPTLSNNPRWEPTVASQLSEFGIQTTVKPISNSAFSNRLENGEFSIWPSSAATAVAFAAHTLFIWEKAATNPQKFGIYPDEQFKTGEFSNNGTPLPRTEERYRVFTIQAPPVGQPNAPVQEYHPAALNLSTATLSRPEYRRRVKIGMWLANWYLPTIPINKRYIQHFIDTAHWLWPTDTESWRSFTDGGGSRVPTEVLGNLPLRANPDNPEV